MAQGPGRAAQRVSGRHGIRVHTCCHNSSLYLAVDSGSLCFRQCYGSEFNGIQIQEAKNDPQKLGKEMFPHFSAVKLGFAGSADPPPLWSLFLRHSNHFKPSVTLHSVCMCNWCLVTNATFSLGYFRDLHV
jgi:hypothetical protein